MLFTGVSSACEEAAASTLLATSGIEIVTEFFIFNFRFEFSSSRESDPGLMGELLSPMRDSCSLENSSASSSSGCMLPLLDRINPESVVGEKMRGRLELPISWDFVDIHILAFTFIDFFRATSLTGVSVYTS
jgi:hypothetical protein